MKKRSVLLLALAIGLPFGGVASYTDSPVHAAESKQALSLAGGATYYGQVKNGLPDGRGTIKWPGGKTYSGSFVNGKRSGTGKYINDYLDNRSKYRIKQVYTGSWSNDRMNGAGTWTEKRSQSNGHVVSNEIQTGTFKNNTLASGYDVLHAEADPEYSFTYRTDGMNFNILGHNKNLVSLWKQGSLFNVTYQKGAVSRNYSIFPEDSAKLERERQSSLKYLQSITGQVTPHLKKFEQLSKQVPLK
ncbi:hypothetical protein [Saccharibacillus kuerlensis]|uniref:MORN repeat-containing protein n=1 Tax=Saccharibacillus kuerlensis TaxID=459527 RepID=A0ABQ2LDN7_9BACL|nr:hypothetical protein [Saccharibacillus kuerlensis]GGO09469.1 hypothetical protein GCM10010969_39920 [Saccharibacillus kuerlensis]